MADEAEHQSSDPHVLDQPWRVWASVAIVGILLGGMFLGVLIIPIVQGWSAGLDAYTAICRALGILPGSPAQPQPFDRTPPTPVSQVVWTPDVLQTLARADTNRGRAKVQVWAKEGCITLGEDFQEGYMSGLYDVPCEVCDGLRVVLEPDYDSMDDALRAKVEAHYEAKAQADAEAAAERRYFAQFER